MEIREIELEDAEELSLLLKHVDDSSDYMLWEPGERKILPEQQRTMIRNIKQSSNSTILVAENKEGQLVGYLMAMGGRANRNKHTAYIVIGILEDYRGQSIGSKLFKALEQWAISHQINRLELTVVTKNKAGIALYQRQGFEIEGTKRASLYQDNQFMDEFYMSKILINSN